MKKIIQDKEEDFLILIVDDVSKNIQLLGKILDNHGYQIVAVTQGDRVIKAAKKHKPDLILLDIMMPEKSGFEVCKELKKNDDLSEIPVIFLTARSEEEDIVKGLNLGGADYVTKPFNSGELLARIETHLSLKKARDKIIRQQEEVQELTKMKEKLYSIIAHDLKGALFGISGLADIVEEELTDLPVDNDIKENVSLISNSANSANLLLENLLSWTRLQTENLEVNPEKFSLIQEIEESIRLYQTQANNKQVNIRIESDDDNFTIFADKHMISTVLRNLISNAIKFSNTGGRVIVDVTNTENGTQVSVKDRGIGMPEEIQQNIFNPEDRPNREGTDKEQGTGLGLLLCKEFIEAHNGDIGVMSEPGKGSDFRFVLPKETNQNGQPAG